MTDDKPIGVFGSWQEKYDLMMRHNVKIVKAEELIFFLKEYLNDCKEDTEL